MLGKELVNKIVREDCWTLDKYRLDSTNSANWLLKLAGHRTAIQVNWWSDLNRQEVVTDAFFSVRRQNTLS